MKVTRILFFDGVCNFCNASVNFVIDRDSNRCIQFAPLQSDRGRLVLEQLGWRPDQMETLVFQDGTELYLYSTAALRIAGYLGFPWYLVSVLLLVPRPLRDTVYRFVARHRYDWFGKSETCRLPTPEERGRFLSD